MRDARATLADAEALARKLEQQAKDVRRAARVIARICARPDGPSESRDGAAWDAAQKVLSEAGILVPDSGLMCWTK